MNELIMVIIGKGFNGMMETGQDGYALIRLKCPLYYLLQAYNEMIKSEIPPIESLSIEEKTKYWEIAKMYYPEKEKAIMASKAAYILSIITNTD